MHSSFFHRKVIVFIHVWFAECWNSSQVTPISPSLILFSFVRLETRNSVVVSGQIQSITFSDSVHHITCTPGPIEPIQPGEVSDGELELLFGWSRVALCMQGQGWSLTSSLSEEGEDLLGLSLKSSHQFMTSLERMLHVFSHSHLPHCQNEGLALALFSWSPAPWATSATCFVFCTGRCRSVM